VDTVASCGEDGLVLIWTRRNGETSWNPVQLHSFGSPVWRVSWSVTGNILAVSSGDSDVSLWKAALDGSWVRCIDVTDTDTGVTAGES
jgi:protein transport protein SEC13